jgi:hypothetical protein
MIDAFVPVAPGLNSYHAAGDPTEMDTWRATLTHNWRKVADYWLKSGFTASAMENPQIAPRSRQLATEDAHQILDNPMLESTPNPPAVDRLPDVKVRVLVAVVNRDVADIQQICGLLYARILAPRRLSFKARATL